MECVVLTNRVCVTLAHIYNTGFAVDVPKLEEVKTQFETEKMDIEKRLQVQIRALMGDTPINLNSPEQMSWVKSCNM